MLQLRNNYINIIVVIVGGVIGLFLSQISVLKTVLIIFGFYLTILFMANIETCNRQLKYKIRSLKE